VTRFGAAVVQRSLNAHLRGARWAKRCHPVSPKNARGKIGCISRSQASTARNRPRAAAQGAGSDRPSPPYHCIWPRRLWRWSIFPRRRRRTGPSGPLGRPPLARAV